MTHMCLVRPVCHMLHLSILVKRSQIFLHVVGGSEAVAVPRLSIVGHVRQERLYAAVQSDFRQTMQLSREGSDNHKLLGRS